MAEESAQQPPPSGPLAGEPRQRGRPGQPEPTARHRAATWLAWWVLLMSLWVAVDDSFASDELLAGAGAAALAALAAEIASHQAATRLRIRAGLARQGVPPARPGRPDTFTRLRRARQDAGHPAPPPRGRFRELPVRYGDDTPLGVTRRVLLTGA